jgi:hypothetical protein
MLVDFRHGGTLQQKVLHLVFENAMYVRPHGEHGLALIDSLKAENLANMRSKGFAPAISIEVTRNEFQAWVKLSGRALPERLRRLAEAGLASAFGGPIDEVVRDSYGLLAGCANHGGGGYGTPRGKYVLAHLGSIEIGEQSMAYVEHIERTLQGMAKEEERKALIQRLPDPARTQTRGR